MQREVPLDMAQESIWDAQVAVYREFKQADASNDARLFCSLMNLNWIAEKIGGSRITPSGRVYLR